MEDIIHVLPDSVANQIAAGEVVQRPSSIVKEMVENSVDAGAKNIQILVIDGGKTNLQIVDDGKGMSETDARLSFERHATSKIRDARDLFNLSTMGFRGEALASIAAVAHVDLKTRRADDELGTSLCIAGSKLISQEPIACPVGCNFSVKDLFYNIPARRKFLKSNQTEMSNIVQEFERVALVNPDISFNLFENGIERFRLPAASIRQRIIDIFGKKINSELLHVEAETSIVTISGYVAKPESSKKKGAKRYFFVNGRYMQHNYFQSAVMQAYENLIPKGDQVSFFIYMAVEPSTIDVNVHPTKTEIKFDNEQAIWRLLYASVKEVLGKFYNAPMIDFDVEGKPDIPVFSSSVSDRVSGYVPPKRVVSDFNPFKSGDDTPGNVVPSNWEQLYDGIGGLDHFDDELISSDSNEINVDDDLVPSSINDDDLVASNSNSGLLDFDTTPYYIYNANGEKVRVDPSVPMFQYKGRYIVLPTESGILLVEQTRAHIRVLFEMYMNNVNKQAAPIQKMLFAEIVHFDPEEAIVIDSLMDDVTKLGFELSNLGGGSYSVSGVPSSVQNINVDTFLHDIVNSVRGREGDAVEDVREVVALRMAKSFSICRGDLLTQAEMRKLICDLFSLSSNARTPDGKIIFNLVGFKSIDKLF